MTTLTAERSKLEKLDMKRELHELYAPPRDPVLVDVPALRYIMVDGRGAPEGNGSFQGAIGVLYGMAYTIKFALKRIGGPNPTVMPLEALWSTEGGDTFDPDRPEDVRWTAMILQPDVVTAQVVERARAELAERRNPPGLCDLRFGVLHERRCAQFLYVGPWEREAPAIERLHAYIAERGFVLSGRHHEIYLSDPRRTAPERLKTVVRQPVALAGSTA